jgi:nitrite reductase/ring-hydroxylating ferredoxin subunit
LSDEPEEFDTQLVASELDLSRPRPVVTPWGTMALFRVGPELFAVQAFCPHLEGPLFQGTLAGEIVTCPWHLWRFNLRTGERVDARPSFFARHAGGGTPPLLRCAVRIGAAGTVILARPAKAREHR